MDLCYKRCTLLSWGIYFQKRFKCLGHLSALPIDHRRSEDACGMDIYKGMLSLLTEIQFAVE